MDKPLNEIGIRLKCLELAVMMHSSPNPMVVFAIETHELANKFQHYIKTNEWPYDTQPAEQENGKDTSQ